MKNSGTAAIVLMAMIMSPVPMEAAEQAVLYLVPTLDDEAYITELEGARADAEEHPSVNFEFLAGTGRAGAADLIAKIESAVTRGTGVIIIDAGAIGDQLRPAVEKARTAGAKIVTVGQPIPGASVDVHVEFDGKGGSVPGGTFVGEHLPDGGKAGLIRCYVGNAITDAFAAGFIQGLEGSGVEVAVTGDAHCDPAEARALVENWLTVHPDLDAILSDTDLALTGAVEAMRAAQVDLVTVGYGGQQPIVKMIAANDIVDATVIYPLASFGEVAVKTAVDLLEGTTVASTVQVPVQGLITRDNASSFVKHE